MNINSKIARNGICMLNDLEQQFIGKVNKEIDFEPWVFCAVLRRTSRDDFFKLCRRESKNQFLNMFKGTRDALTIAKDLGLNIKSLNVWGLVVNQRNGIKRNFYLSPDIIRNAFGELKDNESYGGLLTDNHLVAYIPDQVIRKVVASQNKINCKPNELIYFTDTNIKKAYDSIEKHVLFFSLKYRDLKLVKPK